MLGEIGGGEGGVGGGGGVELLDCCWGWDDVSWIVVKRDSSRINFGVNFMRIISFFFFFRKILFFWILWNWKEE